MVLKAICFTSTVSELIRYKIIA